MTELEEYYNKFNEEKRLNSRHGRVEFITSMKYIHDCLGSLMNEPAELSGKDTYIFVDIFTHISFDLQAGKGRAIATVINGRDAQFSEELHEGDKIELYWKEN